VMLMRRVAEINAIAKLEAMSQTQEFTQGAAQAAEAPKEGSFSLPGPIMEAEYRDRGAILKRISGLRFRDTRISGLFV